MASQKQEFYVTLPSNGSAKFFPNNQANNYQNQLTRDITLEGKWAVALTEVNIPCTWKTTEKTSEIQFVIYRFDTEGEIKAEKVSRQDGEIEILESKIKIPLRNNAGTHSQTVPIDPVHGAAGSADLISIVFRPGNYSSPEAILEKCKMWMAQGKQKLKAHDQLDFGTLVDFEYDKKRRKFKMVKQYTYLHLIYYPDDDAARLLGFDPLIASDIYRIRHVETNDFSPFPPKLHPLSSINIFTNIIEEESVGDTVAPLLRCVDVDVEIGDTLQDVFERPYYKRVNRNHISAIEIRLTGSNGEEIKFESGSVICVLHFRRVSS